MWYLSKVEAYVEGRTHIICSQQSAKSWEAMRIQVIVPVQHTAWMFPWFSNRHTKLMSQLIWYSLIFAFLAPYLHCWPTTACHANMTFHMTCTSLHNHSSSPSTIPYTTCATRPASHVWWTDDLWTMLLLSIFSSCQLPNIPCCRLTGHKPLCCTVRGLVTVSLQTSLVLDLKLSIIFKLPVFTRHKRKFFPEFRHRKSVQPHCFTLLHFVSSPLFIL